MRTNDTAETLRRFDQAFIERNPALLEDVIAPDCIMESMQPAPNGTRYEGYEANLKFWGEMALHPVGHFETEDRVIMGDRATIRWRFHFGDGRSIRGVNLIRVQDGKIAEALAYSKSPAKTAPLPE